jgi:hypothetical protein
MTLEMIANGSRMRTTIRARSTQKLPGSPFCVAMSPRVHAAATHSHGGACESLDAEPGDEPDIAKGRFAGVILPAGIGRK